MPLAEGAGINFADRSAALIYSGFYLSWHYPICGIWRVVLGLTTVTSLLAATSGVPMPERCVLLQSDSSEWTLAALLIGNSNAALLASRSSFPL